MFMDLGPNSYPSAVNRDVPTVIIACSSVFAPFALRFSPNPSSKSKSPNPGCNTTFRRSSSFYTAADDRSRGSSPNPFGGRADTRSGQHLHR